MKRAVMMTIQMMMTGMTEHVSNPLSETNAYTHIFFHTGVCVNIYVYTHAHIIAMSFLLLNFF